MTSSTCHNNCTREGATVQTRADKMQSHVLWGLSAFFTSVRLYSIPVYTHQALSPQPVRKQSALLYTFTDAHVTLHDFNSFMV